MCAGPLRDGRGVPGAARDEDGGEIAHGAARDAGGAGALAHRRERWSRTRRCRARTRSPRTWRARPARRLVCRCPLPPSEHPASRVVSLTEMLDVEELRATWTARSWRTLEGRSAGSSGGSRASSSRGPATQAAPPCRASGKVFVRYEDDTGAAAARNALHGRKFGGNVVECDFIDGAVFASARVLARLSRTTDPTGVYHSLRLCSPSPWRLEVFTSHETSEELLSPGPPSFLPPPSPAPTPRGTRSSPASVAPSPPPSSSPRKTPPPRPVHVVHVRRRRLRF